MWWRWMRWASSTSGGGRRFDLSVAIARSYLWNMAVKKEKQKATPKAPLTTKVLRRVSAEATRKASRKAFDSVAELLVVRAGWLVKVDKTGKVTKHVRKIPLPVQP